jgi:E3 ubiquitin-protein ligase BAH
MKFAHEFQAALLQEGFPPHWVESAVPYGPLKKVIKKVRRELEQIGFNPAELADGVAFQYDFDGDDGYEVFKPKLTLYFKGDQPVNATLSTDTRKYLKILAASRGKADNHSSPVNEAVEVSNPGKGNSHSIPVNEPDDESLRERYSIGMTSSANDSQVRRVEIPLRFDVEFFGLLQEDVTTLDALQAREQKAMTEKITALSKDMANLTSPSKFTKTDMYRWRELFDIYLQAQIFFSTREQDHGSRSSAVAARQLGWFQNEVTRRGLLEDFKLPASLQAFGRFVTINITLLQNLKFQEMNQKAIGKILKSKS